MKMQVMLRNKLFLFATLACLLLTAACGIKPAHVDAPPGSDPKVFPRTYPDPALDPK